MKVVLPGGSGFLGTILARALEARGDRVVVLTRSPRKEGEVAWDGRTLGPWAAELEGADAVVNLTGKSVNCRYTADARREIDESRVLSVEAIDAALTACRRPPRVLVQAASLAIYGDAGDRVCDESAPPGSGFPVETCLQWEAAFARGRTPSVRRVLLRIGLVLGRGGGVLEPFERIVRLFLGGTVGSGEQWVSWIHERDFAGVTLRAVDDRSMQGVYNVTAPAPVTNRTFMRELRDALGRPWSPPAPSPLVRLGAFLMGTEGSLALTGRRGAPARLLAEGFRFEEPELSRALESIYRDAVRPAGRAPPRPGAPSP